MRLQLIGCLQDNQGCLKDNIEILQDQFRVINLKPMAMTQNANEQQLYDCLSNALGLVKKKLKLMFMVEGHHQFIVEQQINERIKECVSRLKRIKLSEDRLMAVLERFMCRMKQIIKQVINMLPKNKIQMLVVLRKLEIISNKAFVLQNATKVICTQLDIVKAISKNVQSSLANARFLSVNKAGKQPDQLESQHLKDQKLRNEGQKGKRQSQVEKIIFALKMYSVLDLDNDYIRGLYFDLRLNKNQRQSQMLQRNNCPCISIKDYLNSYPYQQAGQTGIINRRKKSQKNKDSKRPIAWQIKASKFNSSNLISCQKVNYLPKQRIMSARTNLSRATTINNKWERDSSTQTRMSILYSNGSKRLAMSDKVAYITIDSPPQSQKWEAVNPKRRQFYKRSQQQLLHKHKYAGRREKVYNFSHIDCNSTELRFETIAYK